MPEFVQIGIRLRQIPFQTFQRQVIAQFIPVPEHITHGFGLVIQNLSLMPSPLQGWL
jgi:hypothetical protein